MDVIGPILLTAFVIVAAYFSLKQRKENRGKSYDQRRDEMFEHYEQRIEEFKVKDTKEGDSTEGE